MDHLHIIYVYCSVAGASGTDTKWDTAFSFCYPSCPHIDVGRITLQYKGCFLASYQHNVLLSAIDCSRFTRYNTHLE
mgnify:FL=1